MAVAIAVALALGPALLRPTSQVVGSASVDGFGTQWFFWFAAEVLAGRQAAGWTDLLFHPWGKDIYAHTGGNLVDAWLAAPLRAILGPVAGFDAWVVLLLLTNAWAGARLAAAFGAPEGGRFGGWRWVAAVALVLNPYVLGEIDLGRVTQAWLAPAGLALAGLVSMRSVGGAIVSGAMLGLTALAYWYYGLVLGAVALLHGAWRISFGPDRVRALGLHAVAAAVSLAVVTPFALPMFEALDGGAVPGLLALDGTGVLAPLALRTVEGDEQGLYVLAPLRVAAGSLVDDGGLRFNPGIPAVFAAHLGVGILGVVGLILGRGGAPPATPPLETPSGLSLRAGLRAHGWVPLALVFGLLVASGPAFVLGEQLIPNRAYLALLEVSDVLRRWWWPGRAVFLVHLLVAGVLPAALRSLPRVGRILAAVALLAGVLVPLRREALLPMAAWDATVPGSLACLAAAPPGAVVDVPLLVDQKNLWFQTVHGKPLLGGMLLKKEAFAPAAFTALRKSDPLLATLEAIGERQYTRQVAPATREERAALAAHGYRYVVARVDAFRRPRVEDGVTTWISEWTRPRRQLLAVLGAPAVEDEALAVWTLDGSTLSCAPGGGGQSGP